MTSTEIKTELKRLEKIGIPEDMAMLIAAAKYNKPELAEEVIEGVLDEQQQIINEMSEMRPLEVTDSVGTITPILPENIFFVVDDIYRVNKPFQIEGTFDLSLNVEVEMPIQQSNTPSSMDSKENDDFSLVEETLVSKETPSASHLVWARGKGKPQVCPDEFPLL